MLWYKLGIPVIAAMNTIRDPDGVGWVILGIDDALRAVNLYVKSVADAIHEGQRQNKLSVDEFIEVESETDAPA